VSTLYVTEPRATLRLDAATLIVTRDGETGRREELLRIAPARLELVGLVGDVHITADATRVCLDEGIAVAWFTVGGRFLGDCCRSAAVGRPAPATAVAEPGRRPPAGAARAWSCQGMRRVLVGRRRSADRGAAGSSRPRNRPPTVNQATAMPSSRHTRVASAVMWTSPTSPTSSSRAGAIRSNSSRRPVSPSRVTISVAASRRSVARGSVTYRVDTHRLRERLHPPLSYSGAGREVRQADTPNSANHVTTDSYTRPSGRRSPTFV